MIQSKTERGFSVIIFSDRYEAECSIQKSSLATEDAIWFGVNNPNPIIMASDAAANGVNTNYDPLPRLALGLVVQLPAYPGGALTMPSQQLIKAALGILDPRVIRNLLGRSHVARKARALCIHDRLLTGTPRGLRSLMAQGIETQQNVAHTARHEDTWPCSCI